MTSFDIDDRTSRTDSDNATLSSLDGPSVKADPFHAAEKSFLNFVADAASTLSRFGPLRFTAANRFREILRNDAERAIAEGRCAPGVVRDRRDIGLAIIDTMERALAHDRLSPATIDRFMNAIVKDMLIDKGDQAVRARFRNQYGTAAPSFMVISPEKGCNLECEGCYAASNHVQASLPWPVFEELVEQVRDLWGSRFIVISGGEPLVYRDEGRTILDIAETHARMFFMFYTNGTLITDELAARMAELGNIMPAISFEGLRDRTDARRGEGVFDRVVTAMAHLRQHQVVFGTSMTAARQNADMLLSDEVIDFFFEDQGVLFSWVFHYMRIGRDYTLDRMPTPEQRRHLWQQAWDHIRHRGIFLADFWNSGTIVHGCLAGGRSGGYVYVDWNGHMSPCVFVPYSPVNVTELFAQDKTINDAWADPFFADLRQWQRDYGFDEQLGMRRLPQPAPTVSDSRSPRGFPRHPRRPRPNANGRERCGGAAGRRILRRDGRLRSCSGARVGSDLECAVSGRPVTSLA